MKNYYYLYVFLFIAMLEQKCHPDNAKSKETGEEAWPQLVGQKLIPALKKVTLVLFLELKYECLGNIECKPVKLEYMLHLWLVFLEPKQKVAIVLFLLEVMRMKQIKEKNLPI